MLYLIPVLFWGLENIYYWFYFRKFSIQFLFFSSVVPALFFLLYYHWPFLQFAALSLLFIGFFRASLSDFKSREVDLSHVIEIGVWVVFYRIVSAHSWIEPVMSAFILFAVLLTVYLVTHKKGIGFGDVLIFTFTAGAVHPAGVFLLLAFASMTGLVYALFRMTVLKKDKEAVPWVPFIGLGLFIYLLLEKSYLQLILIPVFQ